MLGLLDRLERGIVLVAEGYLFEMERRGYLKAGPYVPEVVLDEPEAIRQLHREFLRAGSEVMVAFTYYAHRSKLGVIDRAGDLENLNRTAIRLAQEVASEGDALVAGNISNTWEYDPKRKDETSRVVREMFREQVRWAKEEGVDFIIGETFPYFGEALIAMETIKETGLPALISFIPTGEETLDGRPWDEACAELAEKGADVVGLNCGRGPQTMQHQLKKIRKVVKGYVAALPVPYRTSDKQPSFMMLREPGKDAAFPLALDPFLQTRFEAADFAIQAAQTGINYIGLCCGAGPHHIRSMAEALGRTVPASRYSPDLSLHPVLGKGSHADFEKEQQRLT